MKYTENTTIGEIVADLPQAGKVFKSFGIDYCCGGRRLLEDVINEKEIDKNDLYEQLQQIQHERLNAYRQAGSCKDMNPSSLSTYIEDTHHGYLRKALPEINEILAVGAEGSRHNHRELFQVYSLFGKLKTDLEIHLLKEETNLFPAVSAISSENTDSKDKKSEVIALTKEIISEHEAAGQILSELRSITNDYKVPDDACSSYRKAYSMLEELENDLHEHIHLENNILLKEYINAMN